MRRRGLRPNVVAYSAAIATCVEAAKTQGPGQARDEDEQQQFEASSGSAEGAPRDSADADARATPPPAPREPWKTALLLLRAMREDGVAPNRFSCV